MRVLFDRRLTDPTAADVAEVLRLCAAAVNTGWYTGDLVPFDADAAGQRLLEQPSGHAALIGRGPTALQCSNDTARLSVAWWTNPGGRKLVRVRGSREPELRTSVATVPTDVAFQAVQRELHARSAIWHLEPERVVEAFTAGDPEWVAVCGCGAAGSAESLGWHHGMCGPCADRVAEYGLEAVTHAPGLLAADNFEPRDVVFSGDGKYIVAVRFRSCVWDATTGARRPDLDCSELVGEELAASQDGRFVFLGYYNGGALLLRPADGAIDLRVVPAHPIRFAYWTGRPSQLLVQTVDNRLHLINAGDGHVRPAARPSDSSAELCALHPHTERPRAVFARNGNAAVIRVRDDGTLIEEWRFLLGHGRLDRTGMWAGGPQIVRFSPDGERILFVRGTEVELRLPERAKALQQVEFARPVLDAHFSLCGEWVYFLTDAGIHVCHLGMLANVRARLRWHVGSAVRMAVSPDGRTLATAGAEGIKLWLVAGLLPLLE